MKLNTVKTFKSLSYKSILFLALCGWGHCTTLNAEDGLQTLLPSDISWEQRRIGPDVYFAAIYGDPAQPGPYAFRVRAQAGHRLAAHTHADERTVTVLSGTYWTAVGEVFDEDKLQAFPAGSFYVIEDFSAAFGLSVVSRVSQNAAGTWTIAATVSPRRASPPSP